MLGGQIKVALLNTAQSTSVQYTTVDLDLHTLVLASVHSRIVHRHRVAASSNARNVTLPYAKCI